MFCILFGHLMGNGGVVDAYPKNTFPYLVLCFIVNLLNVPFALNSFALVAGYMGYGKYREQLSGGGKIRWEHLLRLEFQALFFAIGLAIAFSLVNTQWVGARQWLHAFFPVTSIHYWYLSAYVPVFLCSPIVFAGISTLSQETLRQVLGVFCILLCLLSQLPVVGNYSTWLASDYAPYWLAFCFFLGAYIRHYGFHSLCPKNFLRFLPRSRFFALCIYLICVVSFFFLIHALPVVGKRVFGVVIPAIWRLASYKSPISIAGALALFYIFLHTRFERLNDTSCFRTILLWFSAGAFGVYLLHCNELVLDHCLKRTYELCGGIPWGLQPLLVQGIAMAIFLVGCLLDSIRRRLYYGLQTVFDQAC